MACCQARRRDADEDGVLSRDKARSAITHLLCGIYALVLVVLGLVFPMSAALTTTGNVAYLQGVEAALEGVEAWVKGVRAWVQIFHLYIYTVCLVFLVYLHCFLLRYKRGDTRPRKIRLVSNNQLDSPDKSTFAAQEGSQISDPPDKENRSRTPSDVDLEEYQPGMPAITYESEGVNFYLRLGAIAFGTGSMIHDGFKIAQVFEADMRLACTGPLYILVTVMHLVFAFFQTFFLFKSHKVVINKHKAFVRFGLTHIIAANICVWILTVILETNQEFQEEKASSDRTEQESALQDRSPEPEIRTTATPENVTTCLEENTLARIAAPYLFPCTIEYSLIAAAIVYKMFQNVGRAATPSLSITHEEQREHTDCHKANKGLFLGLFIAILTLIAVSCFFVFNEKFLKTNIAGFIFYITELTLLFLSALVVAIAFYKVQQLKFTLPKEDNYVDTILLVVSLFGLCVYNGFNIVSAVVNIEKYGILSMLALGTAALAFLQASLQTIFILDGLRRCAEHDGHVARKPGRALVTFLLICNLSLWVVNTFEVEKAESVPLHTLFYGFLPWSIISHVCMPMLIFFRFHSSVCLSDIWIHAYVIKQKEV